MDIGFEPDNLVMFQYLIQLAENMLFKPDS